MEADCDDVPDAPQQRETDPRAAEVAHLSEKLRQAEDLQAWPAISEEPRANGCAAPASGLRRYN
jgi:hypothetical protein